MVTASLGIFLRLKDCVSRALLLTTVALLFPVLAIARIVLGVGKERDANEQDGIMRS